MKKEEEIKDNMKDNKENNKKEEKKEIREIKEVRLKVVEALQDDAYKGIARIDPQLMKILGLNRGDIISIKGTNETVAIVDRAYPADVGEGIIRIDGLIRKNAKASVGEAVMVRRAQAKLAEKVAIAPAQQGIVVQGDPEMIKRVLLGRAVTKGDIISLGAASKRRDMLGGDPFSDMFGDMNELFGALNGGGLPMFGQQPLKFIVVSTEPKQPCVISDDTEVILHQKAVEMTEEGRKVPQIMYEDIGGLGEEVKKIREMVELPLKHPEIFDKLGIEPPKGVLLHGPPGTGKTMLAKAVANESAAHFISVSGPEIFDKFYGESEKNIKKIFDDAEKNAPSIIFFDEIDAIAPSRESNIHSGEVERRVVSQLLTMMDGLKSRGKVVVIGATNRVNSLDAALRRPGRFDREVEINVPNKIGRLEILKIHTRNMPLAKDVNLIQLSEKTHGFVGADLAALAKESAMSVLRKVLPSLKLEEKESIPKEVLDKMIIRMDDFEEALKFVRPSALREVAVETPNTRWEDIGGIELVKRDLKEVIEWPMKFPEGFKRMGIRAPKGVLLYGPPGTGKTLLAKAVAKESEANFIQVNGPELQKEGIVGKETERLRKMFQRAREVAPCVIFFDEIDSFARRRSSGIGAYAESNESLLNSLLTEMDGLEELKNVLVIAATNRPDMLDPALLRPGRFDRLVLVPVPDREGLLSILKIHTKNIPLDKDVDLEKLSQDLDGYTGADIESLCREAAMLALREDRDAKVVKLHHFDKAMEKVPPSVSKPYAETYKKMEQDYLKNAKAGLESTKAYFG